MIDKYFESWRNYLQEDMDTDQIRKVVLIDDNDQILILKRSEDLEKFAGEWDLPGGHTDDDESDITALKREVKEETGLDITRPKEILQKGRIKFYKTRQYSGIIELSGEHTEYKWVTIEDLDSYTIGAKFVKAAEAAFKPDDESETSSNL